MRILRKGENTASYGRDLRLAVCLAPTVAAEKAIYKLRIELGDRGSLGSTDQMLVARQPDE